MVQHPHVERALCQVDHAMDLAITLHHQAPEVGFIDLFVALMEIRVRVEALEFIEWTADVP